MAIPNPTDCVPSHSPLTVDADRKVERAVLFHVLDEHPDRFTIPELCRVMNAGEAAFDREDAVERAIRELVGAGLLRCAEGYVLPTRAAIYYERLVEAE